MASSDVPLPERLERAFRVYDEWKRSRPRSDIESLISEEADLDEYLRAKWEADGRPGSIEERSLPSQIGPYFIVKEIDRGGMGIVYLAEQNVDVRRQVALKVVPVPSSTVVGRFLRERQLLAMMNHDGITKLFDVGEAEDGCLYYAMEYVDGENLDQYCDSRRLTVRKRIELFLSICDAVHHAHQLGVIHRDLKPSNILVTETSGRSAPKIIDFGIAKVLDPDPAGVPSKAMTHGPAGSLLYMSPEQARVDPDINTLADVYSLGSVLYELLVGEAPFAGRLEGMNLKDALETVETHEPERPGDAVRAASASSLEVRAHERSTKPAALARQLDGDLEVIVMKCLRKERRERYGSVSELAADLRSYLDCQPIAAKVPSLLYVGRKFAWRRRRALSLGLMLALFAVVFIFLPWTGGYRAASRNIKEARIALDSARLMHERLDDLIEQARDCWGTGPVWGDSVRERDTYDRIRAQRALIDSKYGAAEELLARVIDAEVLAERARQLLAVGLAEKLRYQLWQYDDLLRRQDIESTQEALEPLRRWLNRRDERLLNTNNVVTLETSPASALIRIDAVGSSGGLSHETTTAAGSVALAEGSYIATIEAEGFVTAKYPFLVRRAGCYQRPDAHPSPEHHVELLQASDLAEGFTYVPGGWTLLSDKPARWEYVESFQMLTRLVSMGQYFEASAIFERKGHGPLAVPSRGLDAASRLVPIIKNPQDLERMREMPACGVASNATDASKYHDVVDVPEGWTVTFPYEREFVRAARGADQRVHPSGDSNYRQNPVGNDRSPFGIENLVSSVRQLMHAIIPENSSARVYRGGNWTTNRKERDPILVASTIGSVPDAERGFRLVLRRNESWMDLDEAAPRCFDDSFGESTSKTRLSSGWYESVRPPLNWSEHDGTPHCWIDRGRLRLDGERKQHAAAAECWKQIRPLPDRCRIEIEFFFEADPRTLGEDGMRAFTVVLRSGVEPTAAGLSISLNTKHGTFSTAFRDDLEELERIDNASSDSHLDALATPSRLEIVCESGRMEARLWPVGDEKPDVAGLTLDGIPGDLSVFRFLGLHLSSVAGCTVLVERVAVGR